MKEGHGPHISIKAEPLFDLFGFHVTNSLFTSLFVTIIFILIAVYYNSQITKKNKSGFFYFIQFIIKSIYDLFQSITGNKINVFFPWLGAFFFYILLQNWFGLLPGVGSVGLKLIKEHGEQYIPFFRANTADLNTTIALGIIAVVLIQYYGFKYLGWKEHLSKFFNFKGPIDFVLGLLEVISEFSRILSFSFRLYGNIFAGEVLLAIMAFLIPVLASFPFLLMEVFVGLIQALVFSMLTAVFLNVAVQKHH